MNPSALLSISFLKLNVSVNNLQSRHNHGVQCSYYVKINKNSPENQQLFEFKGFFFKTLSLFIERLCEMNKNMKFIV